MPTLGTLARNTLWMILGQGLRLLLQFAYFVLIARILHKDGYGAFSGVVALVAVLVPFAGWGSGNLLVKNVAHDPARFGLYWGRALASAALSAGGLTLLVLLLGWWILPSSVPLTIVLWVAISDLLFARLLETSGQAFQAFHKLFKTALLNVLLSVARVGAVVMLLQMHAPDALQAWALLYLAGTAAVGLLACVWVTAELGRPRWSRPGSSGEIVEGFYFASSVSAQRIYMDSDKALLTRLSTLEAAGIYAAAARVVEVAVVPVYAVLMAAYARFFVHGREGVQGTLRFSRRLLPFTLGYALFAAAGMVLFAPLLPWLLGQEFADSVIAVRWLAVMLPLITLHRFAAESLTGAGWQSTRTRIEFLAAVFNVLLNLYLIPRFSWRGAAVVTVLTEALLVVMLSLALYAIVARGAHRAARSPVES